MKLIKSTLVGVFISSMMFAQAPPPPPGGGNPGGPPPGGPPQDGPSPAVVDAFFSTGQQPGGFFDFDAAFDAAESTAKAEAQEAGEYDEESWDECVDAGREAMESARADNKSPQEVFQNIAEAVNACGESQGGDSEDYGDDHMGDDHMGDDQGQPPFRPSVMSSVQKYKENNLEVEITTEARL